MPAADPRKMRQADFAAVMGWHRSTVTRLKQHGRLVFDGALVDVEASKRRIEETGGMRFDVAERHAAQRLQREGAENAASAPVTGGQGVGQGDAPIAGERRSDAQARKESALADMAEMDVAQKRGELILKENVDESRKIIGTIVRARLEVLPDQLAPLFPGDIAENHAILSEHMRLTLSGIAEDTRRAEEAAGMLGA